MKNLLINSFASLSYRQRAYMWAFVDIGHVVATCKKMKMHTDTFYKWMKDPVFKEYHDFVIELTTSSLDALAFKALKEGLEKGDIKAVRTFYELRGKLKNHETRIDNRNVRYEVKFGRSVNKGTDSRLHSSPETGNNPQQ